MDSTDQTAKLRASLKSWRRRQQGLAAERDPLVLASLKAGLTKEEVHQSTGLGRSTIDRIEKRGSMTTETESPCDFRCGYVSSGRDLWNHIAWEHQPCTECGNSPRHDEAGNEAVTHKPDCPRLQPGYVYPATGSGYAPYGGPES